MTQLTTVVTLLLLLLGLGHGQLVTGGTGATAGGLAGGIAGALTALANNPPLLLATLLGASLIKKGKKKGLCMCTAH